MESMKKIMLKLFSVIVIAILALTTPVLAVSESDKDEIDDKIKEAKDKLEDVSNEKSDMLKQVEKLTVEISSYETEVEKLEKEIKELNSEIKEMKAEIEEKEELYKTNYEKMQKRLVVYYENGETSYLDIILSSKHFADVISNWYYLNQITEADAEFLETVEKQKEELKLDKKKLENSKEKVEANKKNVEKTKTSLEKAQKTKKSVANQLSQEEKELQKDIEQFEKDKKEIERQLAELARKENVVITGSPSSHGYIFPVAGLSKANINNKSYPSYPGHTGTDVNINVVGKSVVAVKSGTVVTSTALYGSIPTYDSNGKYVASYRSYGEYIVINHHDGTMTLYGHLKPGSRRVSVGQKVEQGQVIATVGNTGNCLPRPTSSSPNNGTHLHFEVRINGSCVNPIPYL